MALEHRPEATEPPGTLPAAPRRLDGPADPVDALRAAMTEAHTAGTPEPDPVAAPAPSPPAPAPSPAPAPEPIAVAAAALSDGLAAGADDPPAWVPGYVEYHSGRLPRLVLGCLFVPTTVAAVVAVFWAASVGSTLGLVSAAALGGAALMLFRALLEWAPTVVSLSRGQLEVARGDRVVRVDLRSPSTRVVLGQDLRSPGWRTVVSRPGEQDLVIRRRHVRVRQFAEIVGFHRRTLGA